MVALVSSRPRRAAAVTAAATTPLSPEREWSDPESPSPMPLPLDSLLHTPVAGPAPPPPWLTMAPKPRRLHFGEEYDSYTEDTDEMNWESGHSLSEGRVDAEEEADFWGASALQGTNPLVPTANAAAEGTKDKGKGTKATAKKAGEQVKQQGMLITPEEGMC